MNTRGGWTVGNKKPYGTIEKIWPGCVGGGSSCNCPLLKDDPSQKSGEPRWMKQSWGGEHYHTNSLM